MFKSYFKIAWRNLQKNKLYTFVNITGLTVGIASCILIGLYISQELSFDRFHASADRIVRVTMQYDNEGVMQQVVTTGTKAGPQLQRTFPAITAFTRIIQYTPVISVGDKVFNEPRFLFADSAFFNIFTFPLVKGDPATVLAAPNQVVITRTMAKKYFGSADPIGKTLRVNNAKDYTITGIAKDAPENSQIRFNFIASFSSMRVSHDEIWWTANYVTYLLLAHPQDLAPLQREITAYMATDRLRQETRLEEHDTHLSFNLEPLTWVHLHSTIGGLEPNGSITYIYILGAIAILILVIACVNYTNLATAQAQGRTG
jgi:putative ABC transport system permease protein